MSNLVKYDSGIMIPSDWRHRSLVACLPGTTKSSYVGAAALVITPDVLAVISPNGIEIAVHLYSVTDVKVTSVRGILLHYSSSIGLLPAPPICDEALEIYYSMDVAITGKIKLLPGAPYRAHEWESLIRDAALDAQIETGNIAHIEMQLHGKKRLPRT